MGQVIQYGVAVLMGLAILLSGRWVVRLLASGGPPELDPADVVDVEIPYECVVCGMRLTVTEAHDRDVVAPKHCHEPMERV